MTQRSHGLPRLSNTHHALFPFDPPFPLLVHQHIAGVEQDEAVEAVTVTPSCIDGIQPLGVVIEGDGVGGQGDMAEVEGRGRDSENGYGGHAVVVERESALGLDNEEEDADGMSQEDGVPPGRVGIALQHGLSVFDTLPALVTPTVSEV